MAGVFLSVSVNLPVGLFVACCLLIVMGGWALAGGILQFFPRQPRYIRRLVKGLKRKRKEEEELLAMYKRRGLL